MTIRVYSSLDTGAPALPSLSSQRLGDNLKLVLLACLVNGFGSKPAAGWTLGHNHADGFSLGNGTGFINFVQTANNDTVELYCMEAITSGATALAAGVNRRSATWFDGSPVTARHQCYSNGFHVTQPNKHWCVVADSKTVTVLTGGGETGVDFNSNAVSVVLHFGAFTSALGLEGFCCLGGNATSRGAGLLAKGFNGTVLRHPHTGLVEQGLDPRVGAQAAHVNQNLVLSTRTSHLQTRLALVPVDLYGYGAGISGSASEVNHVWCGRLRGLVADPTLSTCLLSKVLQALGVSTPTVQDRIRPVQSAAFASLVPMYASAADLGCFVSLDPADWV